MGKKTDKAPKSQSVGDAQDDNLSKTPATELPKETDPNEPYNCTGQFHTDFHELCRRTTLEVIPSVVSRPRRPVSPANAPNPVEEKAKAGKNAGKNQPPPPEPEPEQVIEESGETTEAPPKTYTMKDKFDYFKPCVQVEMENPDKQETVTDVFIRGWKVDESIMSVLNQSLPKLNNLKSLTLWRTGLNDKTLEMLAKMLEECQNLSTLALDNNAVPSENWHLLIQPSTSIERLSLRFNQITDKGAALLGKALGTTSQSNQKLLVLNLNGNKIADEGVSHICQGLRTNRTLLVLSLANNRVGDAGAKALAEVLSKFELTHEEIVERRKLMSGHFSPERLKSASRVPSTDRPNTGLSSHAGGKESKAGKSAKPKKDAKGKEDTKGKKDDKTTKKASIVAESKSAPKKGEKTKGKGKGSSLAEAESETPELTNPLVDKGEVLETGKIILPGNRCLISLNLSNNEIGEEGVNALLLAVRYQITLSHEPAYQGRPGTSGLMRLTLQRNNVTKDCTALAQLQELMEGRDPIAQPQTEE